MTSAVATRGHALLLDCRDLSTEHVPFPSHMALLLIDSGVSRELVSSAYNNRRAECERAAHRLGVGSLRNVTLDDIDAGDLDETLRKRARHVVTENHRVVAVADALRTSDRAALAESFEASHASLADDFEVSTPQVDRLVDAARGTDGVIAARMTGGGFGGCTINLVEASTGPRAAGAIVRDYAAATGIRTRWWLTHPGAGAGMVPLDGDAESPKPGRRPGF
jgi:galactokinase